MNWPATIATVLAVILLVNLVACWAVFRAWWSHRRMAKDLGWATGWRIVERRRRSAWLSGTCGRKARFFEAKP